MKSILTAAAIAVCASASFSQIVYDSYNGHYYEKVSTAGLTWSQAKFAAEARTYLGMQGYLVTLVFGHESSTIKSAFGDLFGYWTGGLQDIGAVEPGGGWGWYTNEPLIFTDWLSGEPNDSRSYRGFNANEDRIMFWNNNQWADMCQCNNTSDSHGYIVEYGAKTSVTNVFYNAVNGHYYEQVLITNGISWPNAKAASENRYYQSLKGHLVTITSASEQGFLSGTFPNLRGCWYGGFQQPGAAEPGGGWTWITGEAMNYTFWYPGEPNDNRGYNGMGLNEDKLVGWSADGLWNDLAPPVVHIADSRGYIVEYEGCNVPGDTNGDCCVNDTDLLNIINDFLSTPNVHNHSDINNDGVVDDTDLLMVINAFLSGC